MEPIFNTVEFVKTLIISELAALKESGEAADIAQEVTSLFGDYDVYSLVYADAVGNIREALANDCSAELHYFIRRCTFMASRRLTEEYGLDRPLIEELTKGIKAGIEALSEFFTDDDLANCRVMDDVLPPMPVLMIALVNEVLTSTQEELYGEEDAKGAVST